MAPIHAESCQALNGKEFIYGTEPPVPMHGGCQCGYDVVERLHVHFTKQGIEILEEKEILKFQKKSQQKSTTKIFQN